MRLNKPIFLLLFFASSQSWSVVAQSNTVKKNHISEDYYMFPIRPNEVNTLAGNMGELRTTHFHAGLDIRTGGRIGLPVYAAAAGYISRVAVKAGGYGKALYITHGNGETTVYAHLSKFNGGIAHHVKGHQYAQRNLYLNKYFGKGEFVVKKGDIIAYSGNSGSSGGPHLHFEIRDKDQQVLNPLKYNFEEIRDTTPPIFKKLAVMPKNINARINGVFDRITYQSKKQGKDYILRDTITLFGKVGFEILAFDKLDGSNYKCAISEITFELDSQLVFAQKIDTINFSTQRNILTHYNYPAYVASGKKYHKLYLDDGNQLPFYTTNGSKGILDLKTRGLRKGVITIKDVLGNRASLTFWIKSSPPNISKVKEVAPSKRISLIENTLVIKNPTTTPLSIELAGETKQLSPSYSTELSGYYLWDLKEGIPTKIVSDTSELDYQSLSTVIPNKKYTHYTPEMNVVFGKSTLFDTLYFSTSYRYDNSENKEYYHIGNPTVSALKRNVEVVLKSSIARSSSLKSKASVYKVNGKKYAFKGGTWQSNNISFKTREFGEYTILTDSIPPTISPISISGKSIRFTIKDNLSGIKKIDAFVNNQWVLMDYDYKTAKIWSDKIKDQPFSGEVRLRIIDNVGNIQTYSTKIP